MQRLSPENESKRLRDESAALRVKAIHCRMEVAATFCSMAETGISLDCGRARKVLTKVKHTIDEVQGHLDEEGHVPAEAIDELRRELADLKTRHDKIDRVLSQASEI